MVHCVFILLKHCAADSLYLALLLIVQLNLSDKRTLAIVLY